jgi:hypothetical protein
VQGYNAQAVCTEDQIVIAAEVTISSADFGQLEPMVTAAENELAAAGVIDAPQVVLADAGYWHTEQIERLTGRGTVALIPPDAGKRKGPLARAGTEVSTRSCVACSRPSAAASSTGDATS